MTSPYTSTVANAGSTPSANGAITDAMLDALRATKGWVRLIGILLFIAAAFTVLGAIGMTVGVGMMGPQRGMPPSGVFALFGVVYLAIAVIYIYLGLYLVKYSAAVGRLMGAGQVDAMEAALQYQRKFWRLAGIMALIMMVLAVFGIVAAIVIPFFVSG